MTFPSISLGRERKVQTSAVANCFESFCMVAERRESFKTGTRRVGSVVL